MNNEEKIISMLEVMESKITNMDSKVDKLSADVAVLKTDVAALKTDMDYVKSDIEELKEGSEITRAATNKLLDWAERMEKHTITTTFSLPPLTVVE